MLPPINHEGDSSPQPEKESPIPKYILGGIGRLALTEGSRRESPLVEMRHYQIDAWKKLHEHRESGERAALIQMATGLGKTTVIAGDILAFSNDFYDERGYLPKILFLAHQVELLRQAQSRYRDLLPAMKQAEMYMGRNTTDDSEMYDIVFATLQSMSKNKEHFTSNHFDYVVVDESHHAMAPHFEKTIDYFEPEFRLGVTATPFRKDERDLSVLFGKIVYSKSLAEAVSDKLLDAPGYEVVADDLLLRSIDTDFTKTKEFREAIFDESRNKAIAQRIIQEQADITNSHTIIFTQNIAHAEDFAPYIKGAIPLHSELTFSECQDVMRRFRSGEIRTLVAVDMLNEGIDIPEANLAVFLRSTASRTIFEQQLGRVLRKMLNKNARVLDFVGTAERLEMIYELSEEVRQINEQKAEKLGIDWGQESLEYSRFGVFAPQFDGWSIDVIEKIKRLTTMKQPAPEGWKNVGQIADLVQREIFNVYKTIQNLGIRTTNYLTPDNHIAKYLSPEEVDQILEVYQNPKGYVSVADLEIILGMSNSYIGNYINQKGLKTHLLVGSTNSIVRHISPEDAEAMINEHIINEAPTDWVSISELADEHSLSRLSMRRAIKRLGIGATKYATAKHKQISWHVSPEDADKIREFFNPVGWISLQNLSRELGVDTHTIKRKAKQEKLEVAQKISSRTDGVQSPMDHVSQDVASFLRGYFTSRRVDTAPQDAVAVNMLAQEFNLTTSAVLAMSKKLGLELLLFMPTNGRQRRNYLTVEDAKIIRQFYGGKYR